MRLTHGTCVSEVWEETWVKGMGKKALLFAFVLYRFPSCLVHTWFTVGFVGVLGGTKVE